MTFSHFSPYDCFQNLEMTVIRCWWQMFQIKAIIPVFYYVLETLHVLQAKDLPALDTAGPDGEAPFIIDTGWCLADLGCFGLFL